MILQAESQGLVALDKVLKNVFLLPFQLDLCIEFHDLQDFERDLTLVR